MISISSNQDRTVIGLAQLVCDPLVSIVIITRNRREMLRRLLISLELLTYERTETIIADNGSDDGTADMLAVEYPRVRLLRLPENQGITARNEGMRAASGELIFTLDDDVTVVQPDTLEHVINIFRRQPNVGLVCLKICDPGNLMDHSPENWFYPHARDRYQDRSFYTATFNEAAAVFRHDVLKRSGLYFEPMFWGGEERDLTFRILDTGCDILYAGDRSVVHWGPRGMLPKKADPRHRLLVRNAILTYLLRLPWSAAVGEIVPRLGWWTIRSLRYGYFHHYCAGLWGALRFVPLVARERRIISRKTLKRVRLINDGRYWDTHIQSIDQTETKITAQDL